MILFMADATVHFHRHDLPDGLDLGHVVAVDTEAMGLDSRRDRLCLVQLSAGDGHAHMVQIVPPQHGGRGADCPNLKRLLSDPGTTKLMHFARFDVGVIQHYLGVDATPVKCTKIAAKLVRDRAIVSLDIPTEAAKELFPDLDVVKPYLRYTSSTTV